MRCFRSIVFALTIILTPILMPAIARADSSQLIISQFKVTTKQGQFFLIYNAGSEPVDMGMAQLVYYNHYDLSQSTSKKIISLQGLLAPGGYYLVNDGPYTLCYQMTVNSASLGFSTTKGALQIQTVNQEIVGGPVTSKLHDSVSWSKSDEPGVVKQPDDGTASLLRQPVDASNNPLITLAGEGSWVEVSQSVDDPCVLTQTIINQPPAVIKTSLLLLSSTPPPVKIISRFASVEQTGPYMPAGNVGLLAPVVNELLANPGSPATDADDEFIELYNPNNKPFELTGFSIQVGLDKPRKYKFKPGTMLKAKSFTAFYSDQTNLALTNSGSKAELVDPFGNVISKSDVYSSAKDNQAWALANNEWLLTSTPTPGEANVITGNQAITGSSDSQPAVTGRERVSGSANTATVQGVSDDQAQQVADIHPSTLAGVTALAVGYGAYEYRTDLANRVRKFKRNRKSG